MIRDVRPNVSEKSANLISRMYDQADISCLVENEEGENVASTSLDVNYAPTILLHPRFMMPKISVIK